MDLELILFKACPFAQRVVITLLQTGLQHTRTHINPKQPPSWLQEIAPLGQIPLLRINNNEVLFDSSVINEYLNDISGGGLLPKQNETKAVHRCWIEFSGECQRLFGGLITAQNKEQFQQIATQKFMPKLAWLETQLANESPFFNGSTLSLVDAAYAPLFLRMNHLNAVIPFYEGETVPKIDYWQNKLMNLDTVKQSVDGDFSMIFKAVVRGRGKGGYVDSLLE